MRYGIDLVFDRPLLQQGIKYYHKIDFNQYSHALCVGGTGSGKTFTNKIFLSKIAMHTIDAQITVLDFKNEDYKDFHDCKRLYTFERCYDGLSNYYTEFLQRQSGQTNDRSFRLLVIEELESMLAYYDKKQVEKIKNMIATLILMARSFSMQVLISTQRPGAHLFEPGVRDSIGTIIALGNLSKEGKAMLFKGYEDEITKVNVKGAGHMLINGSKFYQIQVPQIRDINKLNAYIRKALS